MDCEIHDFMAEDGMYGRMVVCSRRGSKTTRENCDIPGCPNGSMALCDWPMAGEGRTCDRKLCLQHRRKVGKTRDYCPAHFNAAMRGA